MAIKDTTVIIACAGLGTRLGIGSTKALLNISGKPLIIRQLELLDEFDDIRIVVGYQAEKVIEIVNAYRKDIMFIFNHEYATTNIADSFLLGLKWAREYAICMDGDVLVMPKGFYKIKSYDGECIGVSQPNSDDPLLLLVKNDDVVDFGDKGNFEWIGISKIKTDHIKGTAEYMYQLLEPLLPIRGIGLDARDIDTPEDYENAIVWMEEQRRKGLYTL